MKDLKHLFTALLLLCTTVATAHNFKVNGIYYNITNSTNKTVAVTYQGNFSNAYSNEYTGSVTIPESVTYNGTTYSVTSIGYEAFYGCSGLTSVTIGNSVTSIGDDAFRNCSGLTSVVIPNSVTSIGSSAFSSCKGLVNIVIPNSVTSIGDYAFYNCSGLTSVEIPNSVTSIGDHAFYGCSGLTSVEFNAENCTSMGNSLYPVFGNCTALSTVTIGENVKNIPASAFYSCTGLTNIEIPNSVTSIGNDAFYNCRSLKTVINFSNITFSKGASNNGDVAYYAKKVINAPNGFIDGDYIWCKFNGVNTLACYLGDATELVLPVDYNGENYVIGNDAFYGCSGLTSVEIHNSVTSIGDYAFSNCSDLASITIPNSVTSIGTSAFEGCTGLKEVHVNNLAAWCKIDFNGAYANPLYNAKTIYLNGNLVDELIIPDGVSSIKRFTFYNCATITSVTLPNSIESFEKSAFCGCTGLTSVVIPNSVTSIGYSAFYGCKGLTSVEIPNSVTNIGDHAFNGCSGLTSIVIGNSVTSIGTSAFMGCTGLKEVHVNNLAAWCKIDFNGAYANPLYNAKTMYLNGNLVDELIIPDGVSSIKRFTFYNCATITSVTLPNSIESFEKSAFCGCTGLTSVEIPNSVTSIGDYAFYKCSGLTSVVIPNSVTSIGTSAFEDCTDLKNVYNFSSLTFGKGEYTNGYIAYYADNVYNVSNGSKEGDFIFGKPNDVNTLLYYLGNAAELALPADYRGENYTIGTDVFKNKTTITSIIIPNSVTSIGDDAFAGCSNVERLDLDCAEVGDWFSGVSALKEVIIGDGVTSVATSAFNGCTGLEKVCISDLAAWCGIDFGSANSNPLYYANNLYLNDELLTELSIPNSITSIGDFSFSGCTGLTSITIPNSVTSIGSLAFSGCSNLETLYISNTIESIGDYAFAECNNILDIKIGSKKAITASENIFSSDAYNNACLYVPTGRKDFYAKTSPWSNFIIREMDFTGIEDVEAEGEWVKDVYYDLSGRVVENPSKGIYIINGKKMLVK